MESKNHSHTQRINTLQQIMTLINCPECNKEISSNANACPGCGNTEFQNKPAIGKGAITTEEQLKKLPWTIRILILVGFMFLFIKGFDFFVDVVISRISPSFAQFLKAPLFYF